MSNGRLTDQMGAMALVDDLRHHRMEIEDHLDLPKREAEVAERIRAYYKSQGIDCDDDLVNEGVREFFRHRLVFEAPPMGFWERFAGRMISSNVFRIWAMVMLAFVIMFGISFCTSFTRSFTKSFNESRAAQEARNGAATINDRVLQDSAALTTSRLAHT